MNTASILDCEFAAMTTAETIDWASEWISAGKPGYIFTVNVAILMMMRSNPLLSAFMRNASLVVADGQPIVWASRFQRPRLPERVTGVDLVDRLCSLAAREGHGIYLLGARRPVVELAAKNLTDRHPGLQVAGIADGYFDESEASTRAASVRESGAKILFIAMGVPRQELFIRDHWEGFGAPLVVPVGGSFDVIAGVKKRAPRFVQRVGMEWMFRLAQEPRRLWKRYLITNSQFVYEIARNGVRSRPSDQG